MSEIREAVRSRYANVARQLVVVNQLGSGPEGCCQADGPDCGCSGSYSAEALEEIGLTESVSLGCGNPTMLADLKPGESVLDLGSGAGLDVLLSARRVAPGGHAFGVDMTDEMLALANGNKQKSGVTNATFLKGAIESIPLPEATVDVVISNCVINLAEDKGVWPRRVDSVAGRIGHHDLAAMGRSADSCRRADGETHVSRVRQGGAARVQANPDPHQSAVGPDMRLSRPLNCHRRAQSIRR